MTDELCFTAEDMGKLKENLLPSDVEHCAVLFAAESRRTSGQIRLLVREITFPARHEYQKQGFTEAELSPSFVARASKRAHSLNLTVVFVHTHPGSEQPIFSGIDDRGELKLASFLRIRVPGRHHAALVLSEGGMRARHLGRMDEMRVVVVGNKRTIEFDPNLAQADYSQAFDRQVRAFGATGQNRLSALTVAIVGLGGTGSIACQQLVHLGVGKLLLIDHDRIEISNLNRVVGATFKDVGSLKTDVAARNARSFGTETEVISIAGDITRDLVARQLIEADLIFCCTDSHGSRSVVQQVAYQHFIPCIDLGSTITQTKGMITGIFGRIQLLSPGTPCLWCSSLLDSAEVRRDMMNEAERKLDPYIVGAQEPAPSVVSLNGIVVSLAVTMLLGIVAGVPVDSTHLIYNAMRSSLRPVKGSAQPICFICSKEGSLGWGDDRSLFARQT